MSDKWSDGRLPPTYTTGAREANEARYVLDINSNFQSCMQEHVKECKPEIRFFLGSLTDKSIDETTDPASTFGNAMEMISPKKDTPMQDRFTEAMQAVPETTTSRTPKGRGKAARAAPIANTPIVATPQRTTANEVDEEDTAATYKSLKEKTNLMAMAGPITMFLESILDKQSRQFTARFLRTGKDKHPIYAAIANCQIRTFRTIMETTFNEVFPIEERIKVRLEKLTSFVFDDSKDDLLILREKIMNTVKDIEDIGDNEDGTSSHYKTIAYKSITEYFNKTLFHMSPFHMTYVSSLIAKPVKLEKIEGALLEADTQLRQTNPDMYPPRPPPVRANAARQELKRTKPQIENPCPACMTMFNYPCNHSIDKCYLNPANINNHKDWHERKVASWTRRNPGTPFPSYNYGTAPVTSKRPRNASLKSERGM